MSFFKSSLYQVGLVFTASLVIAQAVNAQETSTPPVTAPATTTPAASQPAKDLPKANDVIKAALDAMGGKKAFDDLKSVSIKAAMSTQMGDMTMDMKSAKPGSFLMEQDVPPMGKSSAGSNGTIGWSHSPMGYQLMDKEQMEAIRSQPNMYQMVFNVESDFPTMETVDMVKFNDMDCYKIKMTSKDPAAPGQFGYFAVEGKLMQGMEVSQEGSMGPTTITFGEWKRFEPLTLFTRLSINQAGIEIGPMNITEVELNTLEPSAFDPPAEVLDLVKAQEAAAASQPAATAPASTSTQPAKP